MITFQIESFIEILEELKPILPLHYEELALNKDSVPLDPVYEDYIARENLGQLIFATARKEGILIGYFIGFIAPGLHYRTCLTCHMDIFFIHPDHRGSKCGFGLFLFVEKELKRRKVQRWFVGYKIHKDLSKFFENLDFERVEVTYSKMLG